MRGDQPDEAENGFGLLELVIAMFLLAIITIALIPALYNGIRYSSTEATTATATRQLNTLVEEARAASTCAAAAGAAASKSFTDGAGQSFTTSGTSTCSGGTVTLSLTARDANGLTLATVTALVFVQ